MVYSSLKKEGDKGVYPHPPRGVMKNSKRVNQEASQLGEILMFTPVFSKNR